MLVLRVGSRRPVLNVWNGIGVGLSCGVGLAHRALPQLSQLIVRLSLDPLELGDDLLAELCLAVNLALQCELEPILLDELLKLVFVALEEADLNSKLRRRHLLWRGVAPHVCHGDRDLGNDFVDWLFYFLRILVTAGTQRTFFNHVI